MASSYAAFDVLYETTDGVPTLVGAGVSVKIRAAGAGADAAESPLSTDSAGRIAAGSLSAIAAGTTVHFRVENYTGLAGVFTQVTT